MDTVFRIESKRYVIQKNGEATFKDSWLQYPVYGTRAAANKAINDLPTEIKDEFNNFRMEYTVIEQNITY